MIKAIPLDRLLPGTVISVTKLGFVRHVGLVSNHWFGGMPMVFASAPLTNGVAEVAWWQFSYGQHVRIEGYPGRLYWWEVIERANNLVGLEYNILVANCEHFVAYCHGLRPQSPQLRRILTAAAVVLRVA